MSQTEILGDAGEIDPELVKCLQSCPMVEVSLPSRTVCLSCVLCQNVVSGCRVQVKLRINVCCWECSLRFKPCCGGRGFTNY